MADERALQEDAECAASADCSLNALQMGSAAKTSDEEDSTENDIDEEGVSSHTNSSIPLHGYLVAQWYPSPFFCSGFPYRIS